MAIQFYLTSAGRNAALNAASLGLNVSLTHIAVGTGKYDPSNAMTLTNAALVSEIERYPLNGGSVEPVSHTLRFIANIEPTQTADGYEIGLITDQGVLFAIAATTSNTPLIRLVANIVSITTFGMILSTLDLTNLIITVDPNTPICVALMNQHLDHPDPHTQYLLKSGGTVDGDLTVTQKITTKQLFVQHNNGLNMRLEVANYGNLGLSKRIEFVTGANNYTFDKNIYAPNINVYRGWYDLTASRALNTPYTNDTNSDIDIIINFQDNQGYSPLAVIVGGTTLIDVSDFGAGGTFPVTFTVPSGYGYTVNTAANGVNTIRRWSERREV